MARELEQLAIGMMVNDEGAVAQCRARLLADDFEDQNLRRLFEIGCELFDRNGTLDFAGILLPAENEQLLGLVVECQNATRALFIPNIDNMIRDMQIQSDCRFGAKGVSTLAHQVSTGSMSDPTEMSMRLQALSEAINGRHTRQEHLPLPTLLANALNGTRSKTDRLWFGLADIDEATQGIERGELVTIAARTGVGKSALCIYPFVRTGVQGDQWAMFFATEMDATRMTRRVIANLSGVSQNKIRQIEPMTSVDLDELAQVTPRFIASKLIFQDQVKYISQIDTAIRIQKDAGKDIRLVVIDYIQQLYIDGCKKSRSTELSEITGDLLRMAKKYQTTIVIAAQMNRTALIGKGGKLDRWAEPDISQIKDCGSIEQDSDRIIILWRDQHDEHMTHCNLAKNREGKTGYFDLDFYGSTMRFYTHMRRD